MLGERYFTNRARISQLVGDVRKLAHETGASLGPLSDESECLAKLHRPFRFMACGEVNAGKSSFLNALVGGSLCEVDVLPTTQSVHWFGYGEGRDEVTAEGVVQQLRGFEFLQEFQVLDTPGTNAVVQGHEAAVRGLLPQMDLIFIILPVTNPWGPATWDFVTRIPEALRTRIVLVLQQRDLSGVGDMEVMVGHMRQLAEQKIGFAPEVFCVSAAQAFEAKLAPEGNSSLLEESGFMELERFISHYVEQSGVHRQALRKVYEEITEVMRNIEERMDGRRRIFGADQGFLRDIENEVDEARKGHQRDFVEHSARVGDFYLGSADQVAATLAERVSIVATWLALFKNDEAPAEIEKDFTQSVQESIEAQAMIGSEDLMATCREHWQTVEKRVEIRLEMVAPDFEEEAKEFEGAPERFAKRLGRAGAKAAVAQKIRGLLDVQIIAQRKSLHRFFCVSLVMVTFAGLLGFFGLHLWALLLLVAGAGAFGVGMRQTKSASQEIVESFWEKVANSRSAFVTEFSEDYDETLRAFFAEYATVFKGVRKHVAELKIKLRPHLEEWNELSLELKNIELDL